MTQHICLTKPKPKRRSPDLIADDIVWALGHVDYKALILPRDETRTLVRRAIADSIEFFRRWDKWHSRKGRRTIVNNAEKVARLSAALESELKKMPDVSVAYMFAPIAARHTVMPVDDILAATLTDKTALIDRLGRLHRDCERQRLLLLPPQKPGQERDRVKDYSAVVARNLVTKLSRRKIGRSGGDTFSLVASLIYELLTGRAGVEFERALRHNLPSRRSAA